jgi:sigma-E factor negative regulatory protein RseB
VGSTLPLLLLVGLVGIAPASAATGSADDDPAALRALDRAVQAARSVGYRGTQVVTAWMPGGVSTQVLDVVQDPGGDRWVTVRETATGDRRTMSWGPAQREQGMGPVTAQSLAALADGYRVMVRGSERVAGRAAVLVVASRDGQDAGRLWFDDASGLLLRQEVLDRRGRLTRMSVFTDLQLGSALPATSHFPWVVGAAVRPAAGSSTPTAPAPWRHTLNADDLSAMRAHGWTCPRTLPGGLQLVDARQGGGAEVGVLHLTYTDGLSSASLFVQHGRLADGSPGPGYRTQDWSGTAVHVSDGWPVRLVWQGGGSVFTVVADAPMDDLVDVVEALPHVPADDGLLVSFADRVRSLAAALIGR